MGSFSHSIGRRLNGLPPRSTTDAGPRAQQVALPDGRKLWVERVPRAKWAQLPKGTQLLLIRTKRRHEPWQQAMEMATLEQNGLSHPAAPCLALAWGWLPDGEPDIRPATILRLQELHLLLRYELRETSCPTVVATILPHLN
ncbi:hypothetical protein [Hymenobacter baengnokdamensis]|uniref:hypothetical protein n=1 Tax=Hymenobacter baengnokdamensis TaxID=2615203 RepID=UPI001248BF2D|nr:hypothetical protein [Hymenobacter baengnokdamensis]